MAGCVRVLRCVFLLAAAALLAMPAQAAGPLEKNFWLEGPRYDGVLPACDDPAALSEITSRFATKERKFWNSEAEIVGIDHVRETAFRPWDRDLIPRRFCTARALISNGRAHPVYYAIAEDLGRRGSIPTVLQRWEASMVPVFRAFISLAAAVVLFAAPLAAQDRRQNTPGEFDFYVLALSWSPSFCEEAAERTPGRAPQMQCGERPFAFVVHGLWPQYEKGFPEYCQNPAPRLSRDIVSSMLDLMPSPRLIFHEWDRHGVCSGHNASRYFEAVRKARAVVKIPEQYIELSAPLTVTPQEVEDAFVKANPGLTGAAIAVSCSAKRLREVRICLSKELGFRECAEVDRRTCRREKLLMPPVRGG
jgi:ribonuclease T2